jgi:mono/diheme cytochrome c family protein
MRMGIAAALIAVLAAGTAAAQDGDAERGRDLAQTWCVLCHVVAPDGEGTDVGPAFAAIAGKEPGVLRAWIIVPHAGMPRLDLSETQIDDVLAYIQSLRPQQ